MTVIARPPERAPKAATLPWPLPLRMTRITNATTQDVYDGAELCLSVNRPGATDALALPSRVGKYRYYRDGSVHTSPTN